MINSGIPETMRISAVEAACRIYNLTPHKSNDFVNPLMKLAPNKKDKLEAIKRLGCIAYAKISNPETKFSDRALKTFLVGFTNTAYTLQHPKSGRFLISRHVRFNEKIVYKDLYGKQDERLFEVCNEIERGIASNDNKKLNETVADENTNTEVETGKSIDENLADKNESGCNDLQNKANAT